MGGSPQASSQKSLVSPRATAAASSDRKNGEAQEGDEGRRQGQEGASFRGEHWRCSLAHFRVLYAALPVSSLPLWPAGLGRSDEPPRTGTSLTLIPFAPVDSLVPQKETEEEAALRREMERLQARLLLAGLPGDRRSLGRWTDKEKHPPLRRRRRRDYAEKRKIGYDSSKNS